MIGGARIALQFGPNTATVHKLKMRILKKAGKSFNCRENQNFRCSCLLKAVSVYVYVTIICFLTVDICYWTDLSKDA